MMSFISGAVMMGFWTISLFFLRFWRTTQDRLFGMFSLTFFLLAIERLCIEIMKEQIETHGYFFLIRLAAFIILIVAIIDKNRSPSETGERGEAIR